MPSILGLLGNRVQWRTHSAHMLVKLQLLFIGKIYNEDFKTNINIKTFKYVFFPSGAALAAPRTTNGEK